jgi:transcriptional regulator with GAF, ATPase, and Fis domain
MIAGFKERLAERIQRKSIGLVMIVDRSGRIRWHAGRSVSGSTVREGRGFSKTHLARALRDGSSFESRDVTLSAEDVALPHSAHMLLIGSLFIHPVDDDLVLYVDSGRDRLDPDDIEFFTTNREALRSLLASLRETEGAEGGLSGSSPAAQQLREQIPLFAIEDEPVLILGETGAGKSRIAQIVHRFSGRSGPFIVVDSPAVPEPLFESELFGHVRGAFTGADRTRVGLAEAAAGGTLFLDEIADVPMAVQAKLLRLIDRRRIRPVGASAEKQIDVRIIAATNRDLAEEISRRRFREDLFFRLNVLTIEVPPMRTRREDFRTLADESAHLLRGRRLGPGFWAVVDGHDWPGNVREFLNFIKRVGIQSTGATIGAEASDLLVRGRAATSSPRVDDPVLAELHSAIDAGANFFESIWPRFLARDLNRRELRGWLEERYWQSGHRLKELARRLNIPDEQYPRFVSALHRYGVHPGRPDASHD